MNVVGAKGQMVIEQAIRDRLGIRPGWKVVQTVVGDRLNLRFYPPDHQESCFGMFAQYALGRAPNDEDIDRAVAEGFANEYLASEQDADEETGSA